MRTSPRLNRYERRAMHQEKLKQDMGGSGLYIYENNTDGDLKLPKPTDAGIRTVGPRRQFEGDSYYKKWVGPPLGLLKLVKEVVPALTHQQLQEQNMAEQKKLLTDTQPVYNAHGKVEHVLVPQEQAAQQLNDTTDPAKKKPDVLLTEDPLDGVEIILG
jgi:hypothetical protein